MGRRQDRNLVGKQAEGPGAIEWGKSGEGNG